MTKECIATKCLEEIAVDGTRHQYKCHGCGQVVWIDEKTFSKAQWQKHLDERVMK